MVLVTRNNFISPPVTLFRIRSNILLSKLFSYAWNLFISSYITPVWNYWHYLWFSVLAFFLQRCSLVGLCSVDDRWIWMWSSWSDNWQGKTEGHVENLCRCKLFHHKSHKVCPGRDIVSIPIGYWWHGAVH